MLEADRLIQMNRIGKQAIASQMQRLCSKGPSLHNCVLQDLPPNPATSVALCHRHLAEFESSRRQGDERTATHRFIFSARHKNVTTRLDDVRIWVAQNEVILLLKAKMLGDPFLI
jgi:hypothetical protein